jgi:hypothetical protein
MDSGHSSPPAVDESHSPRLAPTTCSVPGEMRVPCIYGVWGSLIYLMEAGTESEMWDRDFNAIHAGSVHHGAGLLRVCLPASYRAFTVPASSTSPCALVSGRSVSISNARRHFAPHH